MKTKIFDCVEMKQQAGRQIFDELREKSVAEQVAFWQEIERKYQKNSKHKFSGNPPKQI